MPRRLLMTIASAFLLALPGCAAERAASAPIELAYPAVVENSSIRCPELTAAAKAEWKRATPRPAQWADGKGAKAGELRKQIDALELSERRKNRMGALQAGEYEACRNPDAPKPPTS